MDDFGPIPRFDWEDNDDDLIRASQKAEAEDDRKFSMFDDEEMLMASQQVDPEPAPAPVRFNIKTDKELQTTRQKAFPTATASKAKWAIRLFEEWRLWRNNEARSNPEISEIGVGLLFMTSYDKLFMTSYSRNTFLSGKFLLIL
jgi:hypothetical protein